MNIRYGMLRRAVCAGAAVSLLVSGLFAQDGAPPAPKDPKLFAVSYGDEIHPPRTPPRKITIPNVDGYRVLKGDFHIHSLFSDGAVMPHERVGEAIDNGLDVIAITDHTDWPPFLHYPDVRKMLRIENREGFDGKTIDQNLPYLLAKPVADTRRLLLVPGTEISGGTMPPGHLNALFITDANAISAASIVQNWKQAVAIAAEQGAFIQWNHPGWVSGGGGLNPDQPMFFSDFHEEARLKGHLHGIEVFGNSACLYHPAAHDWCNERDLAVMANSDLHPRERERFGRQNPLRPMTLVLAKERTVEAVREAFFAKRTVGWAANMIFGRDPWVEKLFRSCVSVKKTEAGLTLRNLSDIHCVIEADGKTSELPPQGSVDIAPAKKLTVTNWFVGAFKPLEIVL